MLGCTIKPTEAYNETIGGSRAIGVCLLVAKACKVCALTHPLGRDPNLSNRNGSMLGLFLFRISLSISHRDRETLEIGSA